MLTFLFFISFIHFGLSAEADSFTVKRTYDLPILKPFPSKSPVDLVSEFSVIPSAFPTEHFVPKDIVFATENGLTILEDKLKCAQKVSHSVYRLSRVQRGNSLKKVLVLSISEKTNTLVYEMLAEWCQGGNSREKATILESFSIYFLPSLPNPISLCYDYRGTEGFQEVIQKIVEEIGDFDLIFIFSTGGIKIRYISAPEKSAKDLEELAKIYMNHHRDMRNETGIEMCTNPKHAFSPEVLKEFKWKGNDSLHLSSSLLIQISCCYEDGFGGKAYQENRDAIQAVLMERLKTSQSATTVADFEPIFSSPFLVLSIILLFIAFCFCRFSLSSDLRDFRYTKKRFVL